MSKVRYRYAVREDVPLILYFIQQIAEYEKLSHEVIATEESLDKWIFDKEAAEVLFVLEGEKEVGFALFFQNFSTFQGRCGLYLEDIYILPQYRKKGYGKGLFIELARIAVDRGLGRMDWFCLDWNQNSIDFYKSLGAIAMDEWTVYRLTGDALEKLGKK